MSNTGHVAAHDFFKGLSAACDEQADLVDGVVFGPELQVTNAAQFVDEAPWSSDYTFKQIHYRSLPDKAFDYMSTRDYLWRWNTDWFWCSKNVGAQHALVRRLLGRKRLISSTCTRHALERALGCDPAPRALGWPASGVGDPGRG